MGRSRSLCFALVAFVLFLLPLSAICKEDSERFVQARQEMVRSQLVARGIDDQATLRAMETVPRHLFVPKKYRASAYRDGPLPIGYGQTISQPYIVAFMTEIIGPHPGQRVLEIGTGSGYQAAILAETGARVFTIEIIPELAKQARAILEQQSYLHIHSKTGDGYYGWPEQAPFDAIVVTAAAEFIPPPLVQQLKDGGRMVIPVGSPFFSQTLMLVEKNGTKITTRSLFPVRFVPFRRAE
ncbi:MAG: protein-L-isoaspartate(D-aspartate) O-methyltransferase [Deltaproteobacteria bacterium]|nr:protein-L-isoaspartate(D-aspartate) O-methyltransferase [Deltaproteobacteria bacterium]MCW9050350.1 protein-L-isoaspartate(D-aspartate) O-methyltransferase [Deltaproteobacteria bacterium]